LGEERENCKRQKNGREGKRIKRREWGKKGDLGMKRRRERKWGHREGSCL
jgi:hypothetical protein